MNILVEAIFHFVRRVNFRSEKIIPPQFNSEKILLTMIQVIGFRLFLDLFNLNIDVDTFSVNTSIKRQFNII